MYVCVYADTACMLVRLNQSECLSFVFVCVLVSILFVSYYAKYSVVNIQAHACYFIYIFYRVIHWVYNVHLDIMCMTLQTYYIHEDLLHGIHSEAHIHKILFHQVPGPGVLCEEVIPVCRSFLQLPLWVIVLLGPVGRHVSWVPSSFHLPESPPHTQTHVHTYNSLMLGSHARL